MKIDMIKNEKNIVEFRLEGERHTFPNLLKSVLLGNKDVEYVSYLLDHPTDKSARFVLKTGGKSPKKVLEEASKSIEEELDDFDRKIKKALK